MTELRLHYTDVDGLVGRIFLPAFFGAFAAAGVWFLYLLAAYPPSVPAGAALGGIVLVAITWLFGWLAVRLAVMAWRSGRGSWWLHLSSSGFEVNDRIFRPRRCEWRDVDTFMLVSPSGQFEQAVLAPGTTFAEAVRAGDHQPPALQVGYSLSPGHRPSLARRLFADFRGSDGTKANGILMGFWDRPFDEAVELMNEWLARYKPT